MGARRYEPSCPASTKHRGGRSPDRAARVRTARSTAHPGPSMTSCRPVAVPSTACQPSAGSGTRHASRPRPPAAPRGRRSIRSRRPCPTGPGTRGPHSRPRESESGPFTAPQSIARGVPHRRSARSRGLGRCAVPFRGRGGTAGEHARSRSHPVPLPARPDTGRAAPFEPERESTLPGRRTRVGHIPIGHGDGGPSPGGFSGEAAEPRRRPQYVRGRPRVRPGGGPGPSGCHDDRRSVPAADASVTPGATGGGRVRSLRPPPAGRSRGHGPGSPATGNSRREGCGARAPDGHRGGGRRRPCSQWPPPSGL
jgi:hypothetical protein